MKRLKQAYIHGSTFSSVQFSVGKTIAEIANKLDINPQMVKYHTDPIWRASYNATRNGKHYGKDRITVKNRVAYKRSLVAAGKITAAA